MCVHLIHWVKLAYVFCVCVCFGQTSCQIAEKVTFTTHAYCISFVLLFFRFSNHQAFLDILNEMNDYAGQRELIAEDMMINICIELTKYLQELKQERKMVREWEKQGQA